MRSSTLFPRNGFIYLNSFTKDPNSNPLPKVKANKLKKNFRCISDYNKDDIDYNNIYYKNTLLGKNGFLKLLNGGHNINYNFIGKLYPKEFSFNNIIINRNCLNLLNNEILNLN